MSLKRLQNITLFQKNGDIIDLEYNEELDLLQGDLVIPKTSVGLIETQTVYFMERVSLYGEIDYDDIRSYKEIDAVVHDGTFSFFDTTHHEAGDPELVIRDTFHHTLRQDASSEETDEIIKIRERFGTPATMQVFIEPRDEGYFEDIIVIRLDGEIAIELTAQVFVEGEDERLINRLADFGEYLSKDDAHIFRNHPLDTDTADVSILNRKRKEFLIEMHNIKPFFSSAKGVRGILNLFDFQDLKIKEFWLNPKNGKLVHEDLSGNIIDYTNLQKTSKFGLFFEYNSVVDGLYGDDGLPVVRDNFLFTTDEIIIKLFGLRRWIEEREIGGISDIVDIVGEFVFFNKYRISFSYQEEETRQISNKRDLVIVPKQKVFYLEDLRNNTEYRTIPPLANNPTLSSIKTTTLSSVSESVIGSSYGYDGFDDTFSRGNSKADVGVVVSLDNLSHTRRIGDTTTSYSSFGEDNIATYGNINHCYYYLAEVELFIGGVPERKIEIDIMSPTISFVIHKIGVYDCVITFHHAGGKDVFTKKKMFEVRHKIPNFLAFFKSHPDDVIKKHNRMSEARLRFLSSKIHEYERLHFLRDTNLGFRRVNYKSSDFMIEDFGIRTWEDLDLSGVCYPSIIISSFSSGRYFLQSDFFSITGRLSDKQTMINLYEDIKRRLDKNLFNVIFRDWEVPFIEIVFRRMVYGSINLRAIGLSAEFLPGKDYPFRWNNTNIYEESFFVSPFHPVFFSTDETYIDGIVNANWRVLLGEEEVVTLINSPIFCYTFSEIGSYTIECEIEDNRGNKSMCRKEDFVKVVSAKDYERYIKHMK